MDSNSMSTRERLIVSAQQLLAERGYSATSPRAVLDRSGAGQGSFYHHFTDKADLARTALDRTSAEFRSGWEEALASPGTVRDRVAACFTHTDGDVLHGCPVGRLTQDEGVMSEPHLSAPVAADLSWLAARLETVLSAGVDAGELSGDAPVAELASSICALIQGCYVLSRAVGSAKPFHDGARAITYLLH
jgi:AcrR family transcriptional regulator